MLTLNLSIYCIVICFGKLADHFYNQRIRLIRSPGTQAHRKCIRGSQRHVQSIHYKQRTNNLQYHFIFDCKQVKDMYEILQTPVIQTSNKISNEILFDWMTSIFNVAFSIVLYDAGGIDCLNWRKLVCGICSYGQCKLKLRFSSFGY